jgi:AcrR family transcriptional regulator
MAKAGTKARAPAERPTRERILDATLETLKREGFAGTSARAIARTGGFNQALVFYHYGSVNDLLLAALDATSERRMARYRAAVDGVATLPDLFEVAATIYREDLAAGHMTVLAELIAGSATFPELKPEIVARMEPWIRFTEEALTGVLGDSPLVQAVPVTDIAYAVVALYLGLEMLTHLDGSPARAEALFAVGRRMAGPLGDLLEGGRGSAA